MVNSKLKRHRSGEVVAKSIRYLVVAHVHS